MKEVVSHQKARAIAGEYFPLLREGSEYPTPDERFLGWDGEVYYIRTASVS